MIEICRNTGAPIPQGLGINLINSKEVDSIDLKQVIERFKNPISRLIEEFFWFWPNNYLKNEEDQGLNFLNNGDPYNAGLTWFHKSQNGDPKGIVLHNLTILNHIGLLELYLDRANGRVSLSSDEIKSKWHASFQNWNRLLNFEAFWSFLSKRVREIDDPRLPTGNVRRLRALIPVSLVLIEARLAKEFAERGKYQEAKEVIDLISEVSYHSEIFNEAITIAIGPLTKRLNYLCASAKEHINSKEIKATERIKEFIDQGKKILTILAISEKFKPINDYEDLLANTGLQITRDYGYQTQNDKESIILLKEIKSITKNVQILDEAEHQIIFYKERISNGSYWCSEGYHSLNSSTFNTLEQARKNVEQKKYQKAQNQLEALRNNPSKPLTQNGISNVNTSLAYCLNMQAIEYLENTNKLIKSVPTFSLEVYKRYSYAKKQIDLAGWAAENYKLHQACYEGLLYCMACGKYISYTSDIFTFKYDDVIYVGCSSCIHQYNTEFESKRKRIIHNLKESLNILTHARKLNPKNNQIQENLDFIISIAPKWGISVDNYSLAKNKTKRPTTKPKTSQKNSSNDKNIATLWIVFAVIILIFICIIISAGY